MAFPSSRRMLLLVMFASALDPMNGRITLLLSFVGAHDHGDDGAAAGDHTPAAGREDQQAHGRRHLRCRQGFRLPATRPDQRGRAEPSARRLQPRWAVSAQAPGHLALGRAAAVRVLGACRVDCGDRALSDLPLDHAAYRYRQGLLAWVYGFRRATGAARPHMDDGKRRTAAKHAATDPRTRPTALASVRGSVDRRLAVQRLEQRPQCGHDALLPADDGTGDGRGAKRWSKTMGSLRAVSAPMGAEDPAEGAGGCPLGRGNIAAGTRGRVAYRHPRALHPMEIRESAGGTGFPGKAGPNRARRRPRHRRVLAGTLGRARG